MPNLRPQAKFVRWILEASTWIDPVVIFYCNHLIVSTWFEPGRHHVSVELMIQTLLLVSCQWIWSKCVIEINNQNLRKFAWILKLLELSSWCTPIFCNNIVRKHRLSTGGQNDWDGRCSRRKLSVDHYHPVGYFTKSVRWCLHVFNRSWWLFWLRFFLNRILFKLTHKLYQTYCWISYCNRRWGSLPDSGHVAKGATGWFCSLECRQSWGRSGSKAHRREDSNPGKQHESNHKKIPVSVGHSGRK